MSSTTERLFTTHRLTVDEYRRMGEAGILAAHECVELIEGEIVDMAPIGSRHAGIVKRLIRDLSASVKENAILSVQDPVVLGDYSEPEPDIALLKPRADFYSSSHPWAGDVLLLIEVSESSLRYDREIKLPLYARYQIAEVWLVDVEGRSVTRFSEPLGGQYTEESVLNCVSPVSPRRLPEVLVDLSSLFS